MTRHVIITGKDNKRKRLNAVLDKLASNITKVPEDATVKAPITKAPEDPGVEPDGLQALNEPTTQTTDPCELDLGNESSSKHLILIEFTSPFSKGGF